MHFFFLNKRLALALAILGWLEFSIVPLISIRGVRPDFFFVFLVFYAFQIDTRSVIPLAFLLGLAKDFASNAFFGLETASLAGAAVLLRLLAVRFDREKRWIQMGSLFAFSGTALVLFSLAALLVQAPYGLNVPVMSKAFFIALYTTVFGFALIPFLDRWLRPSLRQKQYELF